METQQKINKKTQTIAHLERKLAIKAEMDAFSKDIILGALISVRKEIEKDNNVKSLFQSIGHSSFMELV